jgi:hypothetical protein
MRASSASWSSSRRKAVGCSRISSRNRDPGPPFSAGDTGLASDDRLHDLERVVEHDDVGRAAWNEAAEAR